MFESDGKHAGIPVADGLSDLDLTEIAIALLEPMRLEILHNYIQIPCESILSYRYHHSST